MNYLQALTMLTAIDEFNRSAPRRSVQKRQKAKHIFTEQPKSKRAKRRAKGKR